MRRASERNPDMRAGVCGACGQTLSRAAGSWVGRTSRVCQGGGEHAPTCEWFALCDRAATGTVAHPILGDVPTCDRCRERAEA